MKTTCIMCRLVRERERKAEKENLMFETMQKCIEKWEALLVCV